MAIALALLERREAAQEDEAVRILDVEQRPEHVHAIRTHAGHGTRLEEADEFGAPAGLDTIGAHFDDHAIPPSVGNPRNSAIGEGSRPAAASSGRVGGARI